MSFSNRHAALVATTLIFGIGAVWTNAALAQGGVIEREELPPLIFDPDAPAPVEVDPGVTPPSDGGQGEVIEEGQSGQSGQMPPPEAQGETPSIEEIAPTPEKKETRLKNPVAEFAGLDKITGRIIAFDVYINETVQFGALQVTPKVCYSRPDAEEPKTDSFVEVDEITLDRKIQRIFTGWMFAESPGISAVEHPIYDVWLKSCKQKSDVPPPETAKNN